MPLATKTNTKWAILAKLEATYGTAVALAAATDAWRTIDFAHVKRKYAFEGKRLGKAPGTAARLALVGTEGPHGEFTMKQEVAGGGAVYTASLTPVNHILLRMCQMKATLDVTGGAEKYTYTPADEADYGSATVESYEGGEKFAMNGCIGEGFEISGDLGHLIEIKADIHGRLSAEPSDAAIPAGVVYNSTVGAKAVASNLTLGSFAPVRVQSFSFKQKLNTSDRAFDNVSGLHGGFHPGVQREFAWEVLIEAPAMPTASPFITATQFNPGELRRAGTSFAANMTIGATGAPGQYKRCKIQALQAQVDEDPREVKAAVRMFKLMLACMPSSETANDECAIVFD